MEEEKRFDVQNTEARLAKADGNEAQKAQARTTRADGTEAPKNPVRDKTEFTIHVTVAEETFGITIPKDPEVESLHRDAAARVNELMNRYRQVFKNSDDTTLEPRKLLTMTAFHLAKQCLEQQRATDDSQCMALVGELDKELEAFLEAKAES